MNRISRMRTATIAMMSELLIQTIGLQRPNLHLLSLSGNLVTANSRWADPLKIFLE